MIFMPNNTWDELIKRAESEGNLSGDFEPVAPGRYSFVVVKSEDKKTKDKTKDVITIRAKVLNAGTEKGKTIFHNFTISPESPKALNIFFREMKALGVGTDFFSSSPAPTISNIASKVDGAVFEAEVFINKSGTTEYHNLRNFRTATEEAQQAALSLASGAPQVSTTPAVPTPTAANVPPAPPVVEVSTMAPPPPPPPPTF